MKKYFLGLVLAIITVATNATTLQDAVNSINGKEVTVSGFIGYSWASDEFVRFESEGHVYDVILEAGRSARKTISGCKLKLFGSGGCIANAKAEIQIKGDEITLLIFELTVHK